jgi:hypothetical protein
VRSHEPFQRDDLEELDDLLYSRARAVVALQEVHAGNERSDVIALRHDVDNSFEPVAKLARWEASRGYRATYFVLHTAAYWIDEPFFRAGLEEIAVLGHEIGLHANALTVALLTGQDPHELLWEAADRLREWGFTVRGVAPHGDQLCHKAGYVNDEQFSECVRPGMGAFNRVLTYQGRTLQLAPLPLSAFGFAYEAYRLPKGHYLSDSGGVWSEPVTAFGFERQLHVLQHPDWWAQALSPNRLEVAR